MFLSEKIGKYFCFSEIPRIFMFPRKAGGFFIWGLKKTVLLKQYPLYALEMCETEAYRKQTGSNVSALLNKTSVL